MAKKSRSAMQLSRRDFLKFSIPATTGLIVIGGVPGSGLNQLVASSDTGTPELKGKALLYDATLCQGPSCRACTDGCREWNKLQKPDPSVKSNVVEGLAPNSWTVTNDQFVTKTDGTKEHHFFMAQCRHCTTASCVAACRTGAMAYRGDYIVVDQKWCIGCGNCVQACPFGVPQLGGANHTSTKCRFCIDRLQSTDPDINGITANGYITTACEERCQVRPIKALRFGNRDELIATAKQEVAALIAKGKTNAHLYGDAPSISGGSHVLFILDQPNSFYGLPDAPGLKPSHIYPDAPRYSVAGVPAGWGGGVSTASALAILPLWLLFRRKKEMEAAKQSGVQGDWSSPG